MEIRCGNCGTKYVLDESLLKREGSRVRCSLCRDIFTAYPPEPEKEEAPAPQAREEEAREVLTEGALSGAAPSPAGAAPADEFDMDRLLAEARRGLEETGPAPERAEERAEEPAAEMTADAPAPSGGEERGASPGETRASEAVRKEPGKRRFWPILLLIVLIAVGVAAAVHYLRPAADKEIRDAGVRRLSFEAVAGSFVDSKEAGQLFVIHGKVRNNYPESRSLVRIKANIMDDKGQVVRQKTAYAGSVYQDEELKVLPMREIVQATENRKGMAAENVKLAPGATIGFMIVFEKLPENLSEFTVEAVSSSPATP